MPIMYAATTPGNPACAIASPMNAIPRSTTYVPTTAHTIPTSADAISARMKIVVPRGSRMRSISGRDRGSGVRRVPRRRGGARRRGRRSAPRAEDVAAVRGRQHLRVEEDLGRPVGDDGAVHREHLLEALRRGRQVVGRGDDRLAAVRLGLEEVHQQLLGRRVDAGDRLVEEEQVRLRGERPGEEHAPALAAREPPDLRPEMGRHADLLERVANGAAVICARPADRPQPRESAHHHHVLDGDREPPVHELGLGHVRDAARLAPGRRAEDLDPPRPRLEEPGHQLEQRALAGAVGADDREQAARLDRERHVLQRGAIAVARRDVAQPDVRVGVGV